MSNEITDDELNLIDSYAIPEDKVMHANGMKGEELINKMRENDCWVAYGASPCRSEGHTVRLRSGHCLGCKPEGLSYLKRHYTEAFLYLAYSGISNLYKIGESENPKKRILELNQEAYGGNKDWILISSKKFENCGLIESLIHRIIRKNKRNGQYIHSSEGLVNSREMFSLDEETYKLVSQWFQQ